MNRSDLFVLADGAKMAGIDRPWQARIHALCVAMMDGGYFSRAEWSRALAAELRGETVAEDGSDYYAHCLNTLEALLAAKGIARKED